MDGVQSKFVPAWLPKLASKLVRPFHSYRRSYPFPAARRVIAELMLSRCRESPPVLGPLLG